MLKDYFVQGQHQHSFCLCPYNPHTAKCCSLCSAASSTGNTAQTWDMPVLWEFGLNLLDVFNCHVKHESGCLSSSISFLAWLEHVRGHAVREDRVDDIRRHHGPRGGPQEEDWWQGENTVICRRSSFTEQRSCLWPMRIIHPRYPVAGSGLLLLNTLRALSDWPVSWHCNVMSCQYTYALVVTQCLEQRINICKMSGKTLSTLAFGCPPATLCTVHAAN